MLTSCNPHKINAEVNSICKQITELMEDLHDETSFAYVDEILDRVAGFSQDLAQQIFYLGQLREKLRRKHYMGLDKNVPDM